MTTPDLLAKVRRELVLLEPAGRPLTDDPAEVEGYLAALAELATKMRAVLDRCERAEAAHADTMRRWSDEVRYVRCATCGIAAPTCECMAKDLVARAEAAERRVAELEGRLEDRSNAWHDRDLRSGAETERAAIVADLRADDGRNDKMRGEVSRLLADRYEAGDHVRASGAHHSSKEGGADE